MSNALQTKKGSTQPPDEVTLASFRVEVLEELSHLRSQIQNSKGNRTSSASASGKTSMLALLRGRKPMFGDFPTQDSASQETLRSKDIDGDYQSEKTALGRAYEELNTKAASLQQENETLKFRQQKLEADIVQHKKDKSSKDQLTREQSMANRFAAQLKEAEDKTKEVTTRLEGLARENQQLQVQNSNMRNLVLKSSKEDEPIADSTLVISFCDLRGQIQRIVHKYYDIEQAPKLGPNASQVQQCFYALWNGKRSPSELRNRTRGVVFELLDDHVFSKPYFLLGIVGSQSGIEQALASFEALINTHLSSSTDIGDWRVRTIKLTSLLPHFSTKDMASKVADLIWRFLEPLLPNTLEEDTKAELEDRLLTLCNNAVDLGYRLRRSRDIYKCEVPKHGEVVRENMEPQDSEGHGDDLKTGHIQQVAFPLFGSLVKYPIHNSAEWLVLEKAHVVVQK